MYRCKHFGRAAATLVVLAFFCASVAPVLNVRAEAYEVGSSLPALASERAGSAYAYHEGKIIVMGGFGAGLSTTVDTVLIYDVATGVTSYGASMPYGAEAIAYAQAANGTVYLFGGYNSTVGAMSVIQAYDPVADEWAVLATGTPIPLSVATGCMGLDGQVYIFGGSYYPNATLIYDIERDFWKYGADNPVNFWGAAAVAYREDAIYVIGGGDLDTTTPSANVTVYNPVDDSWTSAEPLPYAAGFPGATLARNGYIYVFGGLPDAYFGTGSEFWRILRYDVAEDTWEESDDSLSWAKSFPGVVQDEYGRVFVVAGCNGGDASAVVEMFLMSETSGPASLVITAPSDGSTVSGVVVVEATLINSFMMPLMGVDFFVDGELYESQGLGDSWAFSWDTTGLPDLSVHDLFLRGYYWDSSLKEASVTVTVSAMSVDEKLDALEMDIADLMMDLGVLQAEVNEQSTNITALQDAVDTVQTMIDALSAELAGLAGDVDDMDSDVSDRMDDLEAQLEVLDGAMAALQTDLDALQGSLDNAQDSVDDVQASVDNKMDGALGLAIIGLLIVVILLMVVMMLMGRKSKPMEPQPPEPPLE